MSRSMVAILAGIVTFPSPPGGQVGGPPLQIVLERDSESERATAEQLRTTLKKYAVDRWIYTRLIHIDERSIPHSHPVLTLHTRQLGDEHGLLAAFLHEQFHWLEEGNQHFQLAMRSYAQAYPDAPSRGPEGAQDLESTYRHLLVCDLEFQAMTRLVGRERAREVLSANRHYTWIYDRVLNDPKVREIAKENGFLLDGKGDSSRGLIRPTVANQLDYSYRRATIGSSLIALRAGTKPASAAIATSRIATPAKVTGPLAPTPRLLCVRSTCEPPYRR